MEELQGINLDIFNKVEKLIIDNKKVLVVNNGFNNISNFKKALLKMPFHLQKNIEIISYKELLNKLLLEKKIWLKEEKKLFFFYSKINNRIKNFFSIKNYFDVIDIYPNYEYFMTLIKKYEVSKEKIYNIVSPFQKEIIEKYFEIEELLKSDKYLLEYQIYDKEMDLEYISQYDKIFLINPKLDKNYFFIEKNIQKCKNIIHICSKNEQILNKNIEFIETDSNFSSLIYLLKNINNDEKNIIFDKSINNSIPNMYKLLDNGKINFQVSYTLKNTASYEILLLLYEILNEYFKNNKYMVNSLYKAFINENFRSFFNILDYEEIKKSYFKNEIYVNISKLSDNNKNFIAMLDEIIKYEKIEDFYNIFEKLSQFNFKKDRYIDTSISLLESITELKILENFDFFSDFNSIFLSKNISNNLLKFILKFIEAKPINISKEDGLNIYSFDNLKEQYGDNLYILNMVGDINISKKCILNKTQLKELEIKEDELNRKNKEFMLNTLMSNFKKIYITSFKDYDENIFETDYITQLKYTLNKKSTKFTFSDEEIDKLLQHIYRFSLKNKYEKTELLCENTDYRTKSLGIYDIQNIFASSYHYYISSVLNKNHIYVKEDFNENLIVGNILNDFFQDVLLHVVSTKNLKVDYKEFLNKVISKYLNYVDIYKVDILKKMYFEPAINILDKYLNDKLKERLGDISISKEFSLKYDMSNFEINGRADLIISYDNIFEIIDLKKSFPSSLENYNIQVMMYYLMISKKLDLIINQMYEEEYLSLDDKEIKLGLISCTKDGYKQVKLTNKEINNLTNMILNTINYFNYDLDEGIYKNKNKMDFSNLDKKITEFSKK